MKPKYFFELILAFFVFYVMLYEVVATRVR